MKVFNFTDGVRGEQVGSSKIAARLTDHFVGKYKVSLTKKAMKGSEWTWHNAAFCNTYEAGVKGPAGEEEITAEQYGVGAICFCIGSFRIDGEDVWQWHVVGTKEWNREACEKGILEATL